MNLFFIVKVLISGIIIAFVSEIAKKYTLMGGLIAAMPITTLLSMFWLYLENKNTVLITDFLISVFFGMILSFVFFISAIFLLKKGVNFYVAVSISSVLLGIGAYFYNRFFQ